MVHKRALFGQERSPQHPLKKALSISRLHKTKGQNFGTIFLKTPEIKQVQPYVDISLFNNLWSKKYFI